MNKSYTSHEKFLNKLWTSNEEVVDKIWTDRDLELVIPDRVPLTWVEFENFLD